MGKPAAIGFYVFCLLFSQTLESKSNNLILENSKAKLNVGCGYDVKAYGAKGDGRTNDKPIIERIIDSVKVIGGELYFPPTVGPYKISGKLIVPKNVTLNFSNGARVGMGPNDTLIIYGGLKADRYQIFQGNGVVQFGQGSLDVVSPDWWGIQYDDERVDNSISIQKAVNSLNAFGKMGKIIQFAPGRIFVRQTIHFTSGIVFRGEGASDVYGGTQFIAFNMANDTVFKFNSSAYTRWFHHGGIEGISIRSADTGVRPYAAIAISQTGENAIIRNVAIYSCMNAIVLGEESVFPKDQNYFYQVSATLQNLSLHKNSKAGILIQKSMGLVSIDMLSGDENGQMLRIEGASASLSVIIQGLKIETLRPNEHEPAILLENSYCSLSVFGGWITAYGGAKDFIRISGKEGKPRIVLMGLVHRDYPVLIHDEVQSYVLPSYRGTEKKEVRDPVFYNTTPDTVSPK